jgi:hypothetical protein
LIVPPRSTTKTLLVSPGGAVTYTGDEKSPTLASVTVAARAAAGASASTRMARSGARRTARIIPFAAAGDAR